LMYALPIAYPFDAAIPVFIDIPPNIFLLFYFTD